MSTRMSTGTAFVLAAAVALFAPPAPALRGIYADTSVMSTDQVISILRGAA